MVAKYTVSHLDNTKLYVQYKHKDSNMKF